jgi:hypothetical protein
VIKWSAASALLLLTGASEPAPAPRPIELAQVTIRQQVIVRVPIRARPISAASPSLIQWREGKGPKCLPARAIVAASLRGRDSVDLILRDKRRVRAKLESSCPALDYYYGFYVTPNADGMICADRDNIRSRVGGHCEIEAFRSLTPMRRERTRA